MGAEDGIILQGFRPKIAEFGADTGFAASQSVPGGAGQKLAVGTGRESFGFDPGVDLFGVGIIAIEQELCQVPEFIRFLFDPVGLPEQPDPDFVEGGIRLGIRWGHESDGFRG